MVTATGLAMVDGMFDPVARETTVAGKPFPDAHPATAPTYAEGTSWFASSDPLSFNPAAYVKFGVVRAMLPAQLSRVGEVMGTGVFAESHAAAPRGVVYVPVRPGCAFQPYVIRQAIRPRG